MTDLKYPFHASYEEIVADPDPFIFSVFSCLGSEFLVMPKGDGFVDYSVFERGYESLKKSTKNFESFLPDDVLSTVIQVPISFIVIRSILGFTPPEWAYIASQQSKLKIDQGFARGIDRKIRFNPLMPLKVNGITIERINAMIVVACDIIKKGAPTVPQNSIHRLDKIDTKEKIEGLKTLATIGVPYAVLLYERFLGRPFAGHRDSVSDIIGDSLESVIEDILVNAGISYRKTKRAERITGFDQTPDFIIPSELNPQIIIEAKISEDDGTARDKATRIQHLGELSILGTTSDNPKFEVIACIGGRGFGVRREDMKKILLATRGKLFTLKTISMMIENTNLKNFKTK